MSTFSFGSRGWGTGARVQLKFVPTVSHFPTSNTDPLLYAARTWTISWGDGTVDTGTTSSSPSSSMSVTHDYGADFGPRTLTVAADTDLIQEFKITGAGLTSISGTIIPVLTDCTTFDFSNNFLTDLPDVSTADNITSFAASYNNLRGTTPQFSPSARLNTVNLSHNGYDTLDDLSQYGALLTYDISYNPIFLYLGTSLPLYMSSLRVQHCKFSSEAIDLFGAELEANLGYSNQILHTHSASVVAGVPVAWVDYAYDPPPGLMHVTLPFDATDWPDPGVIGKYNIYSTTGAGSLNYEYQPDPAQRLTAISKFGSTLTCEITWRDGQFCILPMTNVHGGLESRVPGSGSFGDWNPPVNAESWETFTFTKSGSGLRTSQAEGGENGVPSAGAQTSWNNVRAETPWYGTGVTPIYNTTIQNTGHARVVSQIGGSGIDYSKLGWMSKRYKSGASNDDTSDMQTVQFAHLMSGIAHSRRAVVSVWYAGLGTMTGDHIDSITLNGTDVPRIGPTIHETNPTTDPYNLETFLSDVLEQQNMVELVFHLDGAATQIAFAVGFMRDVGDLSYVDRPVADTDPVIGRTNWSVLTQATDMIVVVAATRLAGNTAVTIHSDGQFQDLPVLNGNDVVDPWITKDQNASLSGNTMLIRQGVRPIGSGGTTANWYWTVNTPPADWTLLGGAARAFIFGRRLGNAARAFLLD